MPRRPPPVLRPLLLLVLILGGPYATISRTHAQTISLPDMRWVSPTWGYTIRWFSNEWTVVEDSSGEGNDVVALTDTLGNYVAFLGTTDFGGDAEACLDWILADTEAQPGNTDFRLALDATGEPYAYSSPTQAYAVFSMSVQGADGVSQDDIGYVECQTLVPGEAVLERVYAGPPEVFEQWYDDIVATLEGVFLPPSAWLPVFADDPSYVSAGMAPLREEERGNAGVLLDDLGAPQLLIGLEEEAGETRMVTFQNVSDGSISVAPQDVALTLTTLTREASDQERTEPSVVWEDGFAAGPGGSRLLAPGERATAFLEFEPVDFTRVNCDMIPFQSLAYTAPDGAFVEFALSALPDTLSDCFSGVPPQPATGRPVFAPASTLQPPNASGVTRESLLAEMDGQLDHLGRIPLVRLAMPPGVSFADLPSGPLAMFVESGAVDVLLDNVTIPAPAGEQITADSGVGLIVRTGDAGATLLLMVLAPAADGTEPLLDDPNAWHEADLLLPEQDLPDRLAAHQFALGRATLPPGTSIELGGGEEPAPEYTALLVESGSPLVTTPDDVAGVGTILAAGGSRRVPPGTIIQASPDQDAELLLLEVFPAAPENGAPEGGAAGNEAAAPLLDTLTTNPAWGNTIHRDTTDWSVSQEPARMALVF